MVLLSSCRIPRVLQYSGYRLTPLTFAYRAFTSFGLLFQNSSASVQCSWCRSVPRIYYYMRFGLLPFRSPLLWKSLFTFFSSGYLDVSVHRVPLHILLIHIWILCCYIVSFLIRISADRFVCNSPRLFAAYHVLLRRLVPRHPPYALCSLIFIF